MTYYDILEISEKASPEVIRVAHKALCKKYHPDLYQGDKNYAEEKTKQINEAYETLSNEAKKRQYDHTINNYARRTQNTYQAPKQPYTPPNTENKVNDIEISLKRGFMALEVGDWKKATLFFDSVLIHNSNSAEAYLGKLMIELQVKTRETLKNCVQPFDDKYNYRRAYQFADDTLKEFLQETIKSIKKRNYDKRCFEIYRRGRSLILLNTDVECFEAAIAEFEKIRNYKDSEKQIEYCYKKIAEIKSSILAAKAEKERRKAAIKESLIQKLSFIKKR